MTQIAFMNLTWLLAVLILGATVVLLGRRIARFDKELWTVRMATYELTSMLGDDIQDLKESLDAAGVKRTSAHSDERFRKMALTPEARHAESMAKWNATVADFEKMRRERGI